MENHNGYSIAAFFGGMTAFWLGTCKLFFAQISTFYTIGEGAKYVLIKILFTIILSFAGGAAGMVTTDIYKVRFQSRVQKFFKKKNR